MAAEVQDALQQLQTRWQQLFKVGAALCRKKEHIISHLGLVYLTGDAEIFRVFVQLPRSSVSKLEACRTHMETFHFAVFCESGSNRVLCRFSCSIDPDRCWYVVTYFWGHSVVDCSRYMSLIFPDPQSYSVQLQSEMPIPAPLSGTGCLSVADGV